MAVQGIMKVKIEREADSYSTAELISQGPNNGGFLSSGNRLSLTKGKLKGKGKASIGIFFSFLLFPFRAIIYLGPAIRHLRSFFGHWTAGCLRTMEQSAVLVNGWLLTPWAQLLFPSLRSVVQKDFTLDRRGQQSLQCLSSSLDFARPSFSFFCAWRSRS